jgi:hypothetical protein
MVFEPIAINIQEQMVGCHALGRMEHCSDGIKYGMLEY